MPEGLKTVTGKVSSVGIKFNGSLLINDKWYNFGKGVINTAQKGDLVTLTLEHWEYKGKTGVNIIKLEFPRQDQEPKEVAEQMLVVAKDAVKEITGRDFDKEARGKTRCALLAPVMPMLLNASEEELTLAKARIDMLVNYVFGEK